MDIIRIGYFVIKGQKLRNFLIHFLRFIFWAYAMLGYILMVSLVPLILLGLFFEPVTNIKILNNLLSLASTLLSNGFVGLLAIALYGGQFFFSFYLYKKLSTFV